MEENNRSLDTTKSVFFQKMPFYRRGQYEHTDQKVKASQWKKTDLVEVTGVEPVSEKAAQKTTTSVVLVLFTSVRLPRTGY